jgi:hypothetical protein
MWNDLGTPKFIMLDIEKLRIPSLRSGLDIKLN